jgi:site-specific DNA-methyltransferase (adenine-specific)
LKIINGKKIPVVIKYAVGLGGSTRDKEAFKHPAIYPEKLAQDHILSWSNKGDLVLDPMCGSGTLIVTVFITILSIFIIR